MINDLYNTGILSLAANIKHVGSLEAPHGSSRQVSKLCGSWVEADVKIADGKVEDFAIRLQACALGQTSASILSENVIGASLDELTTVRSDLHAMLKENGAPPRGRFERLALLECVRDYPARHASTLLAFEAVIEAFKQAKK